MTGSEAVYADWYVWAKRNLANDSSVCHSAAAAATDVELGGGTREQAIAAARQSMTTGAHLAAPGPAQLERRSYAEWFDWARRELGGVREQQHAAARAATDALARGLGANAAVAAARAAAGIAEPPLVPETPAAQPPPPAPAAPAYAPPTYSPPGYGPPPPYGPPLPYGYPPPAAPPTFAGYAGFWRRFGAYLIDSLILCGALVLLAALAGFGYGIYLGAQNLPAPSQDQLAGVVTIPVYACLLLVVWLYSTLLEASGLQATLGKLALGIKVTDAAGRRIGWGRANGRFWAKLILGSLCFLAFWTVPFSQRKQGVHDMVASTLVVRAR